MPFLLDATLREGAQSPDARLTRRRQLAILRGLGRVGIEEAEIGCASRDGDLRGLVTAARRVAPDLRLSVWCRGLPADLALAAASGADVVHASLPVSDLHLRQRLHRDAGWLHDQIGRAADAARRLGIRRLALGLEDATRAGVERIASVCRRAREVGYERVRLADTVSASGPTGLAVLLMIARSAFAGPVGVHCHDDFALATGNAVAALEAGADWADGCLLGGGERAGTARSEALAAWLTVHGDRRYRLDELSGLCRIAARSLGRRLDRHAPVVGGAIWSAASGLHVDGLAKDPRTYEPFDPALVRGERRLLLGRQSGRGAVRQACLRLGMVADAGTIDRLVARLRAQASQVDETAFHRLFAVEAVPVSARTPAGR
jgi:homocitrate synthase NifV